MRPIDADAYVKYCDEKWIPLNVNAVNAQPTVEPERKTGRWIDIDSETYTWKVRCDKCGHERSMMSTQGRYPKFCEGCGAMMEVEQT